MLNIWTLLQVVSYLLIGLALAVVGFVWVFGSVSHTDCGHESFTYKFAFGTLIILNVIMDIWICFKICVVLHWVSTDKSPFSSQLARILRSFRDNSFHL